MSPVRDPTLLVVTPMATDRSYRESVRAFYDGHLRSLEFGSAVADVILVPLLALNLLGAVTIRGPYAPGILAIFAFIDVSSTAILLVAGYVGHDRPSVECQDCKVAMTPEVAAWTCGRCGARLLVQKGTKAPDHGGD